MQSYKFEIEESCIVPVSGLSCMQSKYRNDLNHWEHHWVPTDQYNLSITIIIINSISTMKYSPPEES